MSTVSLTLKVKLLVQVVKYMKYLQILPKLVMGAIYPVSATWLPIEVLAKTSITLVSMIRSKWYLQTLTILVIMAIHPYFSHLAILDNCYHQPILPWHQGERCYSQCLDPRNILIPLPSLSWSLLKTKCKNTKHDKIQNAKIWITQTSGGLSCAKLSPAGVKPGVGLTNGGKIQN